MVVISFNLILVLSLFLLTMRLKVLRIDNFILLYVLSWVFFAFNVSLLFGYYISLQSFFIPILFTLCFNLPYYIFRLFIPNADAKYVIIYNNSQINKYIILINLIGLVGILSQIYQVGFGLSISQIAVLASELRYTSENTNKVQIIINGFIFSLFFIYGFLGEEIKKHKKSLLLSLLILFVLSIVTSSKAALVMCVAFYLSGISLLYILSGRLITTKIKFRIITYILSLLLVLFFISVIIQIFRYGNDISLFTIIQNSDKIFIYAFGQFSAFGVWLDNNFNGLSELTYGNGLFTGIYSFIFGHDRIAGYYDTFTYITTDKYTNVFTISRFLIQDFSLYGAFVFLIILGYTSSIVKFFCSKYIKFTIIFFNMLLVEVIFGFSTSILSYNVVLLSFLITYSFFISSINVLRDTNK
ncbi:O-antigen polymerase [Photobacterium damselae]